MTRVPLPAAPAYLLAGVLVLFPFLDALVTVWPLQPGSPAWRFGAAGVLSGSLGTPLAGLVGALLVGALAGHGRMLRLLGALGVVVTLALLVAIPLFLLDAVQMRAQVAEAGRGSFLLSTGVAAAKLGGAMVVCAFTARAGLRGGRRPPEPRGRKDAAVGVVGREG